MRRLFIMLLVLHLPAVALAQGSGHTHHAGMDHGPATVQADEARAWPTEPGQAAFAAIQEIVTLLEADPATDWSRVDIEALRQHLIDMNHVTLDAQVASEAIDDGARFTVTGMGAVRESIRRMVFAHAATMNGAGGWTFVATEHPDGAVLTVTVVDPEDVAKVRALGFIGIMTRGMHHQRHHLMIATGHAPHH